jgi:hypothetical protein
MEETTGKDFGGTALAMLKGQSLGEQIQIADAARANSSQVAQVQYTQGGADPVDPAYLPSNPPSPEAQLAALHPGGRASDTAANLAAAPQGAAQTGVSIAALPPTISQADGQAALPPIINSAAGASNAPGGLPGLPTKPAGITGMSAGSRLPTAGSITPAAAAMTAAQVQSDMTPPASPLGAAAASVPGAPTLAAAEEQSTRALAAGNAVTAKFPDGMPVPPRVNNVVPRMPPVLTQANVGTQPLALSNAERRKMDAVKVTASAPTGATPVEAAPIAPVAPPQVPDAMMRALDKYDALMRSRGGGGTLDKSL